MSVYPSFDAATEKAHPGDFAAALADVRIPGCGGEVITAIGLLRHIAKGMSVDNAIRWGDERWTDNMAGGHLKQVEPGQRQADRFKSIFRDRAEAWDFSSPSPDAPQC